MKDPKVRMTVEFEIDSEMLAEHGLSAEDVLKNIVFREDDVTDGFQITTDIPEHSIVSSFFLCGGKLISKELVLEHTQTKEPRFDQDPITKLAADLDRFSQEYDPYEYSDVVDDKEAHIQDMAKQIQTGEVKAFRDYLKGFIEESNQPEAVSDAISLLARLDIMFPPICMFKEEIVKNAMAAADRDGYDQLVIGSAEGGYSFCRSADGKPTTPLMDHEVIVGVAAAPLSHGNQKTTFYDYSNNPIRAFIGSLEPDKEYTVKQLQELRNSMFDGKYQPMSLATMRDALTAENSVAYGLMRMEIKNGKEQFTLSPSIKRFLTGQKPSLNDIVQNASARSSAANRGDKDISKEQGR